MVNVQLIRNMYVAGCCIVWHLTHNLSEVCGDVVSRSPLLQRLGKLELFGFLYENQQYGFSNRSDTKQAAQQQK